MINLKELIAKEIFDEAFELTLSQLEEMIEIPSDEKMGDYAFPCFRLVKTMKKAPQMIAADVAERIGKSELFEKVEQVNAYVNMFINKDYYIKEIVNEVNTVGEAYGSSDEGNGKNVVVDFSSPNIAKPFHIGHIRSTVIGNSISNLYEKLGYNVIRANYLGDYGTQFGKMIVAYRRWGNEEDVKNAPVKTLLGYYTKFHEEAEKDPSLDEEARATFAKLEQGCEEEVKLWTMFREYSLAAFDKVYDMLGISFDNYHGESHFSDHMPPVIQHLEDKGLMIESEGAHIVDLSDHDLGAALIRKSDGSSLYTTRDLATALARKKTYDFYKCIYVVASQQNLHFKQWKKILELLGFEWQKDCIHVPFGLVSLEEGTMSTRKGRVVFLEDVLKNAVQKTKEIMLEKNPDTPELDEVAKQVGIGAVIFQELSNNRIKDYVFSWDKVLNFDGETGPYVQYTHARACSILRNATEEELAAIRNGNFDPSYISGESAYTLVKLLGRVPEVIKDASEKYEPSILTRHLVDIAQSFNKFYHDEHILVDNEDEKIAKLALVSASKTVVAICLDLLGIKAPERM